MMETLVVEKLREPISGYLCFSIGNWIWKLFFQIIYRFQVFWYQGFVYKLKCYDYSCWKLDMNNYSTTQREHETFENCFFVKIGLSNSKKKLFNLFQWNVFKNDEKWFLFHLKSSFHSQDIQIFVLTFWSCRKKNLIRKIRLLPKVATSTWLTNNYNTHIVQCLTN